MAVMSHQKRHSNSQKARLWQSISPSRSCAIAVHLVKHVYTILVDFHKYFLCIITIKHGFQRREHHQNFDSYDSFRQVTINRCCDWNTVTINSPKFSTPEILNIRSSRCSFSRTKNQSVPQLSPGTIWAANELPRWHNPRLSELTVFGDHHFE